MQNFIKTAGKVTIGLDLGDKYCHFYTLDSQGEFVGFSRFQTRQQWPSNVVHKALPPRPGPDGCDDPANCRARRCRWPSPSRRCS